ncbi:MAG: hypothetical protein R3F43_31765 [bacterium]
MKHLVIVAAYARPTVLAHELGHFFDNPRHSDVQAPDELPARRRPAGARCPPEPAHAGRGPPLPALGELVPAP